MAEIDYAARVAKGVALLDDKRPGWERLIDLDILNIKDGTCCVTAQLSGVAEWYTGMEQLKLTAGSGGTYVAHGFNAEDEEYMEYAGSEDYDQDDAYATLNRLWREVITERLAAGSEASS